MKPRVYFVISHSCSLFLNSLLLSHSLFDLSSLSLSQLRCHLLCSPIPYFRFPVLYLLFHSPCPPLYQSSISYPHPWKLSPFVFQSTHKRERFTGFPTHTLSTVVGHISLYSVRTRLGFGDTIVLPISMTRVSCPNVKLRVSWDFLTPCLSLFTPTAIACGFGISLPLVGPCFPLTAIASGSFFS